MASNQQFFSVKKYSTPNIKFFLVESLVRGVVDLAAPA